MKLSIGSLIALTRLAGLAMVAMPLAACIAIRPEDCPPNCSESACSTSASYSPPSFTTAPPPSSPTADAAPAARSDVRDAGALPPASPSSADAGTSAGRADAATAVLSDGGPASDLVVQPPCTDAGTCGKPAVPLCTLSSECGRGGRCADGACQRPCAASTVCGTGDTCQASFCQPSAGSGGQCLYSMECSPGSLCINGYCHGACQIDGDCPNRADTCAGSVCQPDGRPSPQCRSNQDCAGDRECVNAICRTHCSSDENCGPACSGTLCRGGYCVQPQELAPQCSRSATCGYGHTCIDAICS